MSHKRVNLLPEKKGKRKQGLPTNWPQALSCQLQQIHIDTPTKQQYQLHKHHQASIIYTTSCCQASMQLTLAVKVRIPNIGKASTVPQANFSCIDFKNYGHCKQGKVNVYFDDVEEILQIETFSISPNISPHQLVPDCNISDSTEPFYICQVQANYK